MNQETPIGIIAGEGQFPFLVVQGARRQGRSIVVVGFKEHTRAELYPLVDDMTWLRVGQLGKMISFFKKHKIEEIVFAGSISKPKVLEIRPDMKAAKLLLQTRSKNDNALLSKVKDFLRQENMELVSPFRFVPELKTPEGVLGKHNPDKQQWRDINFAWPLAKEIGRLDIGQCLVVKDQMVVAVEAMEGTNATILRAGEIAGPGCVAVKIFKPGQEEYIDQPSIGKTTIEIMSQAGTSCLVIEAEKSLFFDREQAVDLADREGISLIGFKGE